MNKIEEFKGLSGETSQIVFKTVVDGIDALEIDNTLATASVSLYGGHVLTWHPKHQKEPVIWISKLVKFQPGKAIRGGVPICWPWFGAHPTKTSLLSHGYARVTPWKLTSIRTLTNGATELNLILTNSELGHTYCQNSVRLELKITIGRKLEIALKTINESEQEFILTEGLHTYFQISDIADIRVLGLDGNEYIDIVNQNKRSTQQGPIKFNGEFGRIFLNNKATCVIEDPGFNRSIRIEKKGSDSTAVWTPGLDVASKMDDLGSVDWRDMVCVESANALENSVKIMPRALHTLSTSYSVEYI